MYCKKIFPEMRIILTQLYFYTKFFKIVFKMNSYEEIKLQKKGPASTEAVEVEKSYSQKNWLPAGEKPLYVNRM